MKHILTRLKRYIPHISGFCRLNVHLRFIAVDIYLRTRFVFCRYNGNGFDGKRHIGRLKRVNAQASYLSAAPALGAADLEFKDGFVRRGRGDPHGIGLA